MILAVIALLASLNTRSAYQFVDVSGIEVNGDYEAAGGENLKGEHFARYYEWLAESKYIMGACFVPMSPFARSWNPPTPHAIINLDEPIRVYNDLVATNAMANTRWVIGDTNDDTIECFSASYDDEYSALSVEEIAQSAWAKFIHDPQPRGGYVDHREWVYPGEYTMPSIHAGDSIGHTAVNQLLARSIQPSISWRAMGTDGVLHLHDNSYTESVWPNQSQTYYDGSPFVFGNDYVPRSNGEPLRVWQFNDEWPSFFGSFSVENIVKASVQNATSPFTTEFVKTADPKFENANGFEVVGRAGIPITQRSIYLFMCCWKCAANAEGAAMNVKVFAKRVFVPGASIANLAADVADRTPAPTMSEAVTRSEYVAVLFARHAMIQFAPNAYQ